MIAGRYVINRSKIVAYLTSIGAQIPPGLSGGTPTPTPAPSFSVQPSMTPTSGTEGVTLFTAANGLASNTNTYTRRWLLSGTSIGTGTTVTPATTGNLVLEVTANGPGGSTVATSPASVISAATPTPTPTPTPYFIVAGQSQGIAPHTTTANRPSNIAAINPANARIWNPTAGSLQGYVAGTNSSAYPAYSAQELWGPEAEYVRRWIAANPTLPLTVVKLCIDSTPLQKAATLQNTSAPSRIECWDYTLADDPSNPTQSLKNVNAALLLKSYRDSAVAALVAEGKAPYCVGMLWTQGQNDAVPSGTSSTYGTALAAFETWARTNVMGGATTPFIITRVEDNNNWPNRLGVRDGEVKQATTVANNWLLSADAYPIGTDTFHYSPAGTVTHGSQAYDVTTAPLLVAGDGFKRTAAAPLLTALGSTPIGNLAWTPGTGSTIGTTGTQAYFGAKAGGFSEAYLGTTLLDMDAFVDVKMNGDHTRIFAKLSSTQVIFFDTGGTLAYYNNGPVEGAVSFTALDTSTRYGIRFIVQGNVVAVYVNGSLLTFTTLTGVSTLPKEFGIGDNSTTGTARFNNITVGSS